MASLYQDGTTCIEIINIISDLLEKDVLTDLRATSTIGIMIDESTNLSTEKHLILYVTYIKNSEIQIKFAKLSCIVLVMLVLYSHSCLHTSMLTRLTSKRLTDLTKKVVYLSFLRSLARIYVKCTVLPTGSL